MASFTQRLKVVIDVVSQGATKGLSDFRTEVAQADTFTGKLRAGAKNLGSTLTAFTKSPLGAAAAIGAAGTAAMKAADKFSGLAKTALDVGKATGLGTEAASRWIAVADDAGVSAEQFAAGAGRIARTLDSGTWEKYGIATRDAAGQLRSANDVFLDALDLLSSTTSETERARISAALFGKGHAALAPLIGKTREEYEQMLGSVEEGQVITDGEAVRGERWRLAMDRLSDALGEVALKAGEAIVSLAGVVETAATVLTPVSKVFDFLGLIDNTDKPLGKLQENLDRTGASAYDNAIAFGDMFTTYAESANVFTRIKYAALDLTDVFRDQRGETIIMKDSLAALAEQSPEAAQEVVRSLEAIMLAAYRGNEPAKALVEGYGLTIEVLGQLKDLVPGYTSATDDAADATDENAEAVKRQRDAFEQANRKMSEQLELKRKLYGDQRDAIERQRDYNDAQVELVDVMGDANATTDDQLDAIIKLSEGFGTLTGASLDSEEGTKRQIYQLDELLKGIDPSSPLYKALADYITQLKNIPTNVDTQLRLNVIGAVTTKDGDIIGLRTGARALGGPVQAGSLYQVGEGGKPELLTDALGRSYLIPGSDGVVTPAGGAAGLGGGGGNVTFNITVSNPMMSGEQLANELRAYITRNGAGWLTR